MTITNPTPGKFGFIANAVYADASPNVWLGSAFPANILFLDHLTINNGAGAQSITIGEGETGPGSVETALIGPIAMAANTSLQWDFPYGMVLTAAKSLTVDSSSNTALCIFVQGRVQ